MPLVIRGRSASLLIILLIQAVLLTDVLLHDPYIGYDADEHYVESLSKFKLPSRDETSEFFSPPLPYLVPALLHATGHVPLGWAAKAGQLLNFGFSLGRSVGIHAGVMF